MVNRSGPFAGALLLALIAGAGSWPAVAAARTRAGPVPGPVTVTIRTVPPLAGVRFAFDGHTERTDGQGRAYFTWVHDTSGHTLSLTDRLITRGDRRYRFVQWSGQRDPDQAFLPTVTGLPLRTGYTVTAAFGVEFPVGTAFVDQRGEPLDAAVTSATAIGQTGEVVQLPVGAGTVWLTGTTPVYRNSAFFLTDVEYSLQSVVVAGANVVDAGRQRFIPARGATVVVTVPLLDLAIAARHPMPRSVAGTAVVRGPDGVDHVLTLSPEGKATLTGLPRGMYTVDVESAGGFMVSRKVALSRDDTVEVLMVGWTEVSVVAGAAVLLAAGLLALGLVRRRRRGGVSGSAGIG